MAAEERRRGVNFHYSRAAGRYFWINPHVELPTFDENDVIGLTPVPSFSHLRSGTWKKQEVVLVQLDETVDLKSLVGQPHTSLVAYVELHSSSTNCQLTICGCLPVCLSVCLSVSVELTIRTLNL